MKVEGQLNFRPNPFTHEVGSFDKAIDYGWWFMGPPFPTEPCFEGWLAAPLHKVFEPLPGPILCRVVERGDSLVCVDPYSIAYLAAQQPVDRSIVVLTRNIPECLIDPRKGGHQGAPPGLKAER